MNNYIDKKPKLWTKNFIFIFIANFFLFFSFYLLLPILPLYLIDQFHVSKAIVGVVLSVYTIAALISRPLTAYILDMMNRKPIYILSYVLFVALFLGYIFASMLLFFIIIRVFHGLTFGSVTTAGSSWVIDILPPQRRGEGIGYFGVAGNVAMALGPMLSMLLYDKISAQFVFSISLFAGLIGFIFATLIKCKNKVEKTHGSLTFDRFFIPKGLLAGICLLLMAFPYATITSYIPIYAKELNVGNISYYFTILAAGLIFVRLFSGKIVDKGYLPQVILVGTLISSLAFVLLTYLYYNQVDENILKILFFLSALLVGFGYGLIFPAYNTLFVNIAPHNKRASATSTYLTSWDLGIGVGLVLGGKIAESNIGMAMTYYVGAFSILASFIVFFIFTKPHYNRNKLV